MADKQENGEKREFVRAVLAVPVSLRVIDRQQVEKIQTVKALMKSAPSAERENGLAPSSEPFATHLAELLTHIDEKLDRVIALLGGDNTDLSQIEAQETLDISGSGMCVSLCRPVSEGDLLHISLQLPGFPLRSFKTCGEVVRVKPRDSSPDPLFDVGIRFIGISDKERECLIAYAFDQQRKLIRQFKKRQKAGSWAPGRQGRKPD
jgi:hypothetical protein